MKHNVHVRFFSLPQFPEFFRNTIPRSCDVGKLLSISGTVIRTTTVKMLECEREFVCTRCKHSFTVEADFEQYYLLPRPTRLVSQSHSQISILFYGMGMTLIGTMFEFLDLIYSQPFYYISVTRPLPTTILILYSYPGLPRLYRLQYSFIAFHTASNKSLGRPGYEAMSLVGSGVYYHSIFVCSCPSGDCGSVKFTTASDGMMASYTHSSRSFRKCSHYRWFRYDIIIIIVSWLFP